MAKSIVESRNKREGFYTGRHKDSDIVPNGLGFWKIQKGRRKNFRCFDNYFSLKKFKQREEC